MLTEKYIDIRKYCKNNNIVEKYMYLYIGEHSYTEVKDIIEKNNIILDSLYLEISCKFASNEIVEYILNQKIKPTQRCFDAVLSDEIRHVNVLDIYDLNKYKKDIMDISKLRLLLNYGYKITQRDFAEIIKKYMYLPDYKKYGLEIDDKIKNICDNNLYYPYDEMKTSEINALFDFAKFPSIERLKIVIKRYNILPDSKFAQFMFMSHKRVAKLIKHIVTNYNIKPDKYCIKWAVANNWTEQCVMRIFGA
jgi:hypothetical protein